MPGTKRGNFLSLCPPGKALHLPEREGDVLAAALPINDPSYHAGFSPLRPSRIYTSKCVSNQLPGLVLILITGLQAELGSRSQVGLLGLEDQAPAPFLDDATFSITPSPCLPAPGSCRRCPVTLLPADMTKCSCFSRVLGGKGGKYAQVGTI